MAGYRDRTAAMKNTPAFPIQHQIIDANDTHFKLGNSGMSLRDYFAAKAMQSVIIDWGAPYRDDNFSVVSNFAYKMADAMLKARGE